LKKKRERNKYGTRGTCTSTGGGRSSSHRMNSGFHSRMATNLGGIRKKGEEFPADQRTKKARSAAGHSLGEKGEEARLCSPSPPAQGKERKKTDLLLTEREGGEKGSTLALPQKRREEARPTFSIGGRCPAAYRAVDPRKKKEKGQTSGAITGGNRDIASLILKGQRNALWLFKRERKRVYRERGG